MAAPDRSPLQRPAGRTPASRSCGTPQPDGTLSGHRMSRRPERSGNPDPRSRTRLEKDLFLLGNILGPRLAVQEPIMRTALFAMAMALSLSIHAEPIEYAEGLTPP